MYHRGLNAKSMRCAPSRSETLSRDCSVTGKELPNDLRFSCGRSARSSEFYVPLSVIGD